MIFTSTPLKRVYFKGKTYQFDQSGKLETDVKGLCDCLSGLKDVQLESEPKSTKSKSKK